VKIVEVLFVVFDVSPNFSFSVSKEDSEVFTCYRLGARL